MMLKKAIKKGSIIKPAAVSIELQELKRKAEYRAKLNKSIKQLEEGRGQIHELKTVPKVDPFYSESNIKHLEKVIARIESGESILKEHKIPGVDE